MRAHRPVALLAVLAGALGGAGTLAYGAFSAGFSNTSTFSAAADFVPVIRSVPDVLGAPRSPTGAATLQATSGDWYFNPDSYTYQWVRCDAAGANCVDIATATTSSYTLTSGDVAARLRVRVVAINGSVSSAARTSEATDTVKSGLTQTDAPTVSTVPVISGTTAVGQTLSVSRGVWNPDVTTVVTHQWQRCDAVGSACVDITGATGATYLLTLGDQGRRIRVKSTGQQGVGTSNYTLSADTSIVD